MRKCISFILLVFLLFPINRTFAATRISIDKPVSESLFSPQVLVEGRIINPPDNYIRIKIEHFIERKGYKAIDYIVPLSNGRFKKTLNLPPGISIITASSLDNQSSITRPFLFFSEEKSLREEDWGKESPITFTSPAEIRTSQSPCQIKGSISNPSLKNIEIMVVNLTEFQRLSSGSNSRNMLRYKKIPVKDARFVSSAPLGEGINLIIARPESKNATKAILTKAIVYEPSSQNINLPEAKIEKENLKIAGTVKEAAVKTVTVRAEALIRKEAGTAPIFETIYEKEIPLDPGGKFNTSLNLKEINGIFDKTYFLVSVISGKDKTVRLIVK